MASGYPLATLSSREAHRKSEPHDVHTVMCTFTFFHNSGRELMPSNDCFWRKKLYSSPLLSPLPKMICVRVKSPLLTQVKQASQLIPLHHGENTLLNVIESPALAALNPRTERCFNKRGPLIYKNAVLQVTYRSYRCNLQMAQVRFTEVLIAWQRSISPDGVE